jgi:hypothetical protein
MKVPLNGITSIPNFMKIYEVVQKLLVTDTNRQTERQTGYLVSLLSFLESRLKQYQSGLQELLHNCLFCSSG